MQWRGCGYMISYEGLNVMLAKKGITKTQLSRELGISSRTIAKIAKGEKLGNITLKKIAEYLDCDAKLLVGTFPTTKYCSF